MKIFLIGAGQVGATIVEALHEEHELIVLDLDESRLAAIAQRYDVSTSEGNGASRRVLGAAGVATCDLLIACTSRDESNIVSAMISKAIAPRVTTIVRTTNPEYLEVWHEGQLDVDFIVSSEVETANAITRTIAVPAARQTDVFAEGQVQLVEFDVDETADPRLLGMPLREVPAPPDSRVAAIIRRDDFSLPGGNDSILPGDRIVVIGSPQAAQAWGELIAPASGKVRDVVIYGAGQAGTAVARALLEQGIGVRLVEASLERARVVAGRAQPRAGLSRDWPRSRLPRARAHRRRAGRDLRHARRHEEPLRRDAREGARRGASPFATSHDAASVEVYERAGIDVSINPRQVTAEEIVRFAHDPRTQQVSMLEGDRFEVLDITTRPGSEYVGMKFREMPIRGALIGAIVRNGDGGLPARRRDPAARRPRHHLHRVAPRARRRARPVSVVAGRRHVRAPLLAVDIRGALNVIGTLVAYLSAATLVPAVDGSRVPGNLPGPSSQRE